MKTLKEYLYLVPVWMREDESFNRFYSEVIQVLLDCQQAKEDIINSFTLSQLANYDKSLEVVASYFGINRNFYLASGNLVTGIVMAEDESGLIYEYTPESQINISISNEVLLRLIKFKLLQSNFDGTLKNLIENFDSLFKDEIAIQFIESSINVLDKVYPELNLNLVLTPSLTVEEATLFLNGAYSFNYLGVKTTYTLGGKTVELVWDQSEWDQSNWK